MLRFILPLYLAACSCHDIRIVPLFDDPPIRLDDTAWVDPDGPLDTTGPDHTDLDSGGIVEESLPDLETDTETEDTDLPNCEEDPHDVLTWTVYFPARQECSWGLNGNLTQLNEHNQAREVSLDTVTLPDGATLCSLDIRSTTSNLEFDDHFTLTLDDWILIGGGSGYSISLFPEVNGLRSFDWNLMQGQPFAGRSDPYWCLGEPLTTCAVPPTESPGRLDFDLAGPALGRITQEMAQRQDLPFYLYVFGDDDAGDCQHTNVFLEVTIEYVQ